ncbi:MAG: 4-phosphoerythronate dehydrogenase [Bacteroidales bacterium]
MKIIVDKNIPYLKSVLEPYAEVKYMDGGDIDFESSKNADALIIRTRTKCNKYLLEAITKTQTENSIRDSKLKGHVSHSKVSIIATATIGTDHCDTNYLKSNIIVLANAPGCNAGGVMQYVWTSLYMLAYGDKFKDYKGRSGVNIDSHIYNIGIVGVGNTGGRVADLGEKLGYKVLRNDPPRVEKENIITYDGNISSYPKGAFCNLDYLLEHADIISLHLPLNSTTIHMADRQFYKKWKHPHIFINACRGECVDEAELLKFKENLDGLIIDVWNDEPANISLALLAAADITTPHIAGYSIEGKMNGTAMAVRAIAKHFKIKELYNFYPAEKQQFEDDNFIDMTEVSGFELAKKLHKIFPIEGISNRLQANPREFEKIRKSYELRREFCYKK